MPKIIWGVNDTIAMIFDCLWAVLFLPEISIVLKRFILVRFSMEFIPLFTRCNPRFYTDPYKTLK